MMKEKDVFKLLDNLHNSDEFQRALAMYKKDIKAHDLGDMAMGIWFFSRGFLTAVNYMNAVSKNEKH